MFGIGIAECMIAVSVLMFPPANIAMIVAIFVNAEGPGQRQQHYADRANG